MTTPNEPNKTRTIPLHIADQAVAACEAEIQKLKEENAQLKHKLGRLLGAQQEWTLVEPEHYARLKEKSECQAECLEAFDKKLRQAEAEVERLKEGNDCLDKMHEKEMARSAYLCEQVERLEKGIQPEGSNDAVGRAVELLLEKEKEIERLKAEVERLQSIHSIDSIGIEQLKAEVERLTADLNKMTKTPEGVHYVEVDVGFWTKSGSRLPSSYRTFWSNDKGVQS